MAGTTDRSQVFAYTAAAAMAGLALLSLGSKKSDPSSQQHDIISSPRLTLLPHLSDAQAARLPYPPNALPGARDVDTPFGSMRVYEWGPESGRRVLFVHGDATPSPIFAPIAHDLVARGCRVMAFDLWGRGYTDTPADCHHDSRLYTQQIPEAILSSPLPWMDASHPVSLIGFSMGGALVLDFFARYPDFVESIVLLGPAGLIRNLPAEYKSPWFQYPSLVSSARMRRLIGAVMEVDLSHDAIAPFQDAKLTDDGFTPAGALQFQFDHHHGHVLSFLSTIRHGPLQGREATWKSALDIISGQSPKAKGNPPLAGGQILVICGESDTVIPPADVKEDLIKFLPDPAQFVFKIVPGGHGFPWAEGKNIASYILDFWGLSEPKAKI